MCDENQIAIELYEKALALLKKGELYHSEAFDLCKKSEKLGNTYAMCALGVFYLKGVHVSKDFSQALRYFEKAYDLKNPKAAYNLYVIYKNENQVETNISKIEKYANDSLDFAFERINNGDKLAFRFLSEDMEINDKQISKLLHEYNIENMKCSICNEKILSKNKYFNKEIAIPELEEKGLSDYSSINFILKSEPLLHNGNCCYECYFDYVQPIKKAFEKGLISNKIIDEIMDINETNNRLISLKKLVLLIKFKT